MGFPGTADQEWYRDYCRRTWCRQNPAIKPAGDSVRIGSTIFDLAQFKRTVENFAIEFGNASRGDAEILKNARVHPIFRLGGTPGQPATNLSVEFVFALRPGTRPKVSSRLDSAESAKGTCHRLLSEIDNQVSNGRYDSQTTERLVADLTEHLRTLHNLSSPHEEAPDRQD